MGSHHSLPEAVSQKSSVTFTINGEQFTVESNHPNIGPETRLVDYIRDHAGLKGTKYMCREGGCGICTVAVKTRDVQSGQEIIRGVNSCLAPVLSCDGWEIMTIESLGNQNGGLHPIQQRFVKMHGTQCGYCTPGWIMNTYSMVQSRQRPSLADVEDCTDGNYCRCTGYRPILDAMKSLARDAPEELKRKCIDIDEPASTSLKTCDTGLNNRCCKQSLSANSNPLTTTLEPIHMQFKYGEQWVKAHDMQTLFLAIQNFQNNGMKFKIVAGNTGTGVYKMDGPFQSFVELNSVQALLKREMTASSLILGGATTISTALEILNQYSSMEGFEYFKMISKHWKRVANVSVRNVGTLAGNLMLKHAHPEFPSDIFLVLETIGGRLTIASSPSLQQMHTLLEFLQMDMTGKVIYSIHFPKLPNRIFRSFKITRRYQNAHAYVNAGFLFNIDMSSKMIRDMPSITYGGIAPGFVHASKTEEYLMGKTLNEETIQMAMKTLDEEVQPTAGPLDGDPDYRKSLTKTLLYKAILGIMGTAVDPRLSSGSGDIEKKLTHAKQFYEFPTADWPLNQPVPKLESQIQVTGEAEYTNDIPPAHNEIHGAVVTSTVANASLKRVDTSEALKFPGVVGWVDFKDIPGGNNYMKGIDVEPDAIFVQDRIRYAGEPIGVICAETREAAIRAAALVKVEYENIGKPVVDIPSALEKLAKEGKLENVYGGAISSKVKSLGQGQHTATGEFRVGAQIHLPTEPTACICVPRDDSMDVHSTTQYVDRVQIAVATALGWPCHKVNVFVRRLGGGFGIKLARSAHVAAICAVASHALRRPARVYLDMETSISMHGKRQPHHFKYEVSFDDDGRIKSLNHKFLDDVGCSYNEVTDFLTLNGLQGCYNTDGWTAQKGLVKTDLPPNTFCRAPGVPKATGCTETIMDHIAWTLKKDPMEVRLTNLLKKGDAVFPRENQVFEEDNKIPELLKEMGSAADISERMKFVERFNSANRWKKRGLAIMPARAPVEYLFSDYKVFIAVYGFDGTVAVCHSGVEMGQGINTKVAQVVASELGVPLAKIKIKPPDSVRCANTTLTGTAITSELVCHAALKACKELKGRLDLVKDKVEIPTWENVAAYCKQNGMDLVSYGCTTYADQLKPYDLYSLTVSEVEIDCLTGEYKILRVDMITDIGCSISPDVDVGQIEGAFVMGLGYFLQERVIYDKDTGAVLTNRTWDYKPPFAKDLPEIFRLHLTKNTPNKYGVLRSKTTGEPPLLQSFSVVLALRRAISAARMDAGNTEWFMMDPPITPEVVQRLCLVDEAQFSL